MEVPSEARPEPSLDDTVWGRVKAEPGLATRSEAEIILIFHPQQRMLGARYLLPPGSALEIGRSASTRVNLIDVRSVSRRHARLSHEGDSVTLEDLGSTNGTFVNDRRIFGPTTLRSDDRFQIGAVHFKFLHDLDIEHSYHRAISDLVSRDGLTSAYNRRKFEEEVERECSRATRYHRSLSLILFDLDGFKGINDRHGHLFGDLVLRRIASAIEAELRAEQLFARIGGDEFAILSPESSAEDSRRITERFREQILSLDCRTSEGALVPVSASFGIAELGGTIGGPQALYAAADHSLYSSKLTRAGTVTVFAAPASTRQAPPEGPSWTRRQERALGLSRAGPPVKNEILH